MTSGPITSWQIDTETMETTKEFIFLGSKIHCNHKIKREDIKLKDAYSLEEKL